MIRSPRLLLCVLCLALVPACGEDEPTPHGLEIQSADSEPVGEPAQIGYGFEDGETWEADVFLEARQTVPERASSRSSIEIEQTFHAGEKPHSTSSLRFARVESSQGDVEPPKGATEGRFDHTAAGRPKPETRTLSGKNIALADTVYGSMMLSGLAGSASWIPDRPFRQGEAWPVDQVLTPRMVALLLQLERQSGAAIPKPVFHGSVKVDRIDRDGQGGGSVVLTVRAMVEVKGEMVSGKERGEIDLGYRVEGTATVDLRTGLPTSIDASAELRLSSQGGGVKGGRSMKITLRAEAKRR